MHDLIRRLTWSALVVLLVAVAGTASAAPDRAGPPTLAVRAVTASMIMPIARRVPAQPPLPNVPVTDAALRPVRSESRTEPTRVDIAGVDISLPVVDVGVRKDHRSMELPDTVRKVGWYRFGGRPADHAGTTVLAAHVDTVKEGVGPFAKLAWVDRGTVIAVTDRAGHAHRYRVKNVDLVARTKIDVDRIFARDGPRRLIILTCGGSYDRDTGYRDNVIVTAVAD